MEVKVQYIVENVIRLLCRYLFKDALEGPTEELGWLFKRSCQANHVRQLSKREIFVQSCQVSYHSSH